MTQQEFADRVAELVRGLTGAEETNGVLFDTGQQVGVAIKFADYPKRHAKREFLGLSPIFEESEAERVALELAHYFNGWHTWVLRDA